MSIQYFTGGEYNMWRKFKSAVTTSIFFVLIGFIILGVVLFIQNLSAIIGKFADTPITVIIVFVTGALALKAAQILKLYRARKIRAKKAAIARRKAAIAARVKTDAEAKAKAAEAKANTAEDEDVQ